MLQRLLAFTGLPQYAPIRKRRTRRKHLLGYAIWLTSHPHDQLAPLNSLKAQSAAKAATQHSSACEEAVRAEFAKAGISNAATARILQQYEPLLRWDAKLKLRPALELWAQVIGTNQLAERLQKSPKLLISTPEKCGLVYTWLASLGVDADLVQQRVPGVVTRQLSDVQATVAGIQKALQLPHAQLGPFFKRHYHSLRFSPQHTVKALQVIAELTALPMASEELLRIILRCDLQLFVSAEQLQQRISFFCHHFKGGRAAAAIALKNSIYQVPEQIMQKRSAELGLKLGWTTDELNRKINAFPVILTLKPSTIAANMQALQTRGFTAAQALAMCSSQPALMGCDWTSASNIQKLEFLSSMLQIPQEDIVTRFSLLTYSIETRIGPRSAFLYTLGVISPDMPILRSGLASWLQTGSDAVFAARFDQPPHFHYTTAWKQHWQQRWRFLRNQMGLSIADIAACRALTLASLDDTLAPRWQILKAKEAEQAGFRAAEHLQALATLTDERFAEMYSRPGLALSTKL